MIPVRVKVVDGHADACHCARHHLVIRVAPHVLISGSTWHRIWGYSRGVLHVTTQEEPEMTLLAADPPGGVPPLLFRAPKLLRGEVTVASA